MSAPTATLSRPGFTNIDLPVRGPSGDRLVGRALGKRELEFHDTNRLEPRTTSDQHAVTELIQFQTFFKGSTADRDARLLADFIKSPGDGNPITVDIPLPEYDSTITTIADPSPQALTLTYETIDLVFVTLTLVRVDSVSGPDRGTRASTPTASGSGPIEIRGSSNIVDFENDGIGVSRTLGRPNDVLDHIPQQYPDAVAKEKSTTDIWSLSLRMIDNAQSRISDLLDIFRDRIHRDTLTLDFNGRYGLGAMAVQVNGDGAIENEREGDGTGAQVIPKINLRRVNNQ